MALRAADAAPAQLHGLGRDRREDLRRRRNGRQHRPAAEHLRALRPRQGRVDVAPARARALQRRGRRRARRDDVRDRRQRRRERTRPSTGARSSPTTPPRNSWSQQGVAAGAADEPRRGRRSAARSTPSAASTRSTPSAPSSSTTRRRNRWSIGPSLPERLHAMAAVVFQRRDLGDRRAGRAGKATHRVWIYNPRSHAWRRGPAMPVPMETAGAAVAGDEIHVVLESTYLIYDARTHGGRAGPSLKTPRHALAVYAINGDAVRDRRLHHAAARGQRGRREARRVGVSRKLGQPGEAAAPPGGAAPPPRRGRGTSTRRTRAASRGARRASRRPRSALRRSRRRRTGRRSRARSASASAGRAERRWSVENAPSLILIVPFAVPSATV